MKTGMGVEIKPEDQTANFVAFGKTCPIGKFDPSDYPNMTKFENKSWEEITQDVFDQLEDSDVFTNAEQHKICEMKTAEFVACIQPK